MTIFVENTKQFKTFRPIGDPRVKCEHKRVIRVCSLDLHGRCTTEGKKTITLEIKKVDIYKIDKKELTSSV